MTAAQDGLDRLVEEQRAVEHEARRRVEAGPNPVRVEQWIAGRARRAPPPPTPPLRWRRPQSAAAAVVPLADRLQAAEAAEAEARRTRDDVQQRAGAAGLVGLLAVGAPCPLCLHDVATLPEHHVSEDLERVERALADATAAVGGRQGGAPGGRAAGR